jgi:hypothetical protein
MDHRLITGHRPQLFFGLIEHEPLFVVARRDFQIPEGNGDILLTDTEETTDTNNGRRDTTATVY